MVFTPVHKLDDRTISAIMALEWNGPLTFVMQRDNPNEVPAGVNGSERHSIGVKNHLHQYQRGRDTFLSGDYDALLVIEDDMVPPPDTLMRLAAVFEKYPSAAVAHGVYMFRHGVQVINILRRYYPWPTQARNIGESLSVSDPNVLHDAKKRGVIDCSGSGLGCILIKREVIEAIPFEEHPNGDNCYFDWPWTESVYRKPYRLMADMNLHVGHIDEEGEVIWPPS